MVFTGLEKMIMKSYFKKKNKKRIIFFGKLPPPFIGPAVATKVILDSNLKNHFDIIHFDINHLSWNIKVKSII